MPAPTTPRSWRDSWPPTQMRLHRSIEPEDTKMDEEPDLSFIDDDPLTFFLEPAPLLDGGESEEDIDMMDFDAGIEDVKHPPPIVRSVSPSSLEGLGRPPVRPPTPPRSPPSRNSPEVATPDYEDDGEDYIRFGKPAFSLREFAVTAKREKERRDKALAADMMLSSSAGSLSVPKPSASRGRPVARPGLGRRTRSWSSRQSPHAWREPSPDVWSIEEEQEEELLSDVGSSVAADEMGSNTKPIDIPAAKPKKRVRFAFPVREEIP